MSTLIKLHVLPGGILPKRQTDGAIGFDTHLRAIVSPTEMDIYNPILRKTLFDFENIPEDPAYAKNVRKKEGKLIYRLQPGESVLGGIGFVTEMKFPLFYWLAPRSGLASKFAITLENAPGTVDPDYRGEAGAVICNNGRKPFDLEKDMRIAQIIFQEAIIPQIDVVESFEELDETERGSGGFGSTGITAKKQEDSARVTLT